MNWSSKSKYRNKKVEYNNIVFDSKKECERYKVLHQMEVTGQIHSLERQKRLEIIPKQIDERAAYYTADFWYYDQLAKKWVIEDVKGYETVDYVLRRKLVKLNYNTCLFRQT